MATSSPYGPGTNQYGTKPKQGDPAHLLADDNSESAAASAAADDPFSDGPPTVQPSAASVMRREARHDTQAAVSKLAGRSGLTSEQKLARIDAGDQRISSAASQVHAAAESYGGFVDDPPTHPLLTDTDDPHEALPMQPQAGLTAKNLRRLARSHAANAAPLLVSASGLDEYAKRAWLTGAHQHLTAARDHLAAARATFVS